MSKTVVFLGTSEFAVPFLHELIEHPDFNVKAVFTQPDKKAGRKQELLASPVKKVAEAEHIPVYQPLNINSKNFYEILLTFTPDYLMVVSFGQILSDNILTIAKIANLNAHASLLPKYRGAAPIQNALLHGDSDTGVSIQIISEKLDSGEIVGVKKCLIDRADNAESLSKKLSEMGSILLIDILEAPLLRQPQDEREASYCKKIKKEDGEIIWKNKTAWEIECQIRAFVPWPGSHTFLNRRRIRIVDGFMSDKTKKLDGPGKILDLGKGHIGVQCQEGLFELDRIQLEGKKEMDVRDFAKGYRSFIGNTLGPL